ncbi:MAG TPA: TylF/MycF/NovP-related O-methyltransferase [Caulobacteraceae bacterium]|jgi:O-methyltransferase
MASSDNFYLVNYFDWRVKRITHLDRMLRRLLPMMRFDYTYEIDRFLTNISGKYISPHKSGLMTNIEQRINIYHLVEQTLAYSVDGDIVELGCNEGQTSVLIARIMSQFKTDKTLHVFDSFEGLPTPADADGTFLGGGQLKAKEEILLGNFRRYDLLQPRIIKGWFEDTLSIHLPGQISFAHLDGDLYESIFCSLENVYPRLSPGAICLIDDYCDPVVNPVGWNRLPGVKKACDEYMADKAEQVTYLYSGGFSHGYFRKST